MQHFDYSSGEEDLKINVAPAIQESALVTQPQTMVVQGPINPFSIHSQDRNMQSGYIEQHHMSHQVFKSLERTFTSRGYTLDPNDARVVGDLEAAKDEDGVLIQHTKQTKRKRKSKGDVAGTYYGPWAGFEGEEELEAPTEEIKNWVPQPLPITKEKEMKQVKESTTFHGESEYDYLGRTYMHIPQDVGLDLKSEENQECFIPKSVLHTFTGHTKGVNSIKFFPKSAHLLLSCSMDTKIKLWDVFHDRPLLRTFSGHSKAVKEVVFNSDGTKFLSASYDKWIKLWDTETGQCISRFTTKKTPHCLVFHPDRDDVFLTGCQDKKIYQFNIDSPNPMMEYDQHLGAVNTITFIDDNSRFITTSDDKTMRAWDFDVPVVTKYLAEPTMFSMPAVTLSPDRRWLLLQSLDNQILVYETGKLRLNRKKAFKGHLVSGYACKPSFSPDGHFVLSGDAEGKLTFWDWKTAKVIKQFQAHDSVLMSALWHPHHPTQVATCSWDGTIKLWE